MCPPTAINLALSVTGHKPVIRVYCNISTPYNYNKSDLQMAQIPTLPNTAWCTRMSCGIASHVAKTKQ